MWDIRKMAAASALLLSSCGADAEQGNDADSGQPLNDAASAAVDAGDAGQPLSPPGRCFAGATGELDLEFPTQNPLNACMVNPYPEGGDCYQCALERCCTLLQCCSNAAHTNFMSSNGGGQVFGCVATPLQCIQQCFADSNTAGGTMAPSSAEVVSTCTNRCVADALEPASGRAPSPEFAEYAQAWVDCLVGTQRSDADAYFAGFEMNARPAGAAEPRFADVPCASACFPGY
jgi:hypothetical protein